MAEQQPIIRGIQAVGSVGIYYRYNGAGCVLKMNSTVRMLGGKTDEKGIDTTGSGKYGIPVAGFRLDQDFLDANPQIASSFMIPILGGGAVALTNNNRSGVLTVRCTKVSTPSPTASGDVITGYLPTINEETKEVEPGDPIKASSPGYGAMYSGTNGLGVVNNETVYDLTFLLQTQQQQPGGDSCGATITIVFTFNGLETAVQFQGCTVASIKPLGLSGNNAVDYNATINYLNWVDNLSDSDGSSATANIITKAS